MLLSINDEEEIPEANFQYKTHKEYKKIRIKDILNRMEGNEIEPVEEEKSQESEHESDNGEGEGDPEKKEKEKKEKKEEKKPNMTLRMYKIRYLKKVTRLAEGSSFGELALLTTKPRSTTIKAVTKTDLAILNKSQFRRVFSKVNKKILKHNIEHTL